jgi:hypothetical protein
MVIMTTDLFPLDATSPVGQLRLLISDSQLRTDPMNPTAPGEYYFSDDFLGGFISMNGGYLKLAAADALMALATNASLVDGKIRKENLQTDGPAVTNALRLQASDFRAEGKLDREEADAAAGNQVSIVDFDAPITPFDYFQYISAGGPAGGLPWH